jgi:very-short-patch-repair endonuclease
MSESNLEIKFRKLWENSYPSIILQQEKTIIKGRKFRFDFIYLPSKVAIEINGGIWMGKSGHSSGKGIQRDYEKINLAQVSGWIVFQLSSEMINDKWINSIYHTIQKRRKC